MSKKNPRRPPSPRKPTAAAASSQAQVKRDRQQRGIAASLAIEAQRLFPALSAGKFDPMQLRLQAQYVIDMAQLQTERHATGEIKEDHAGHLASSMEHFASALAAIGVKVPGLLHVKQRHYLDVIRYWERHPPGDSRWIGWTSSHLRRIFVPIDRIDVVPRGTKRLELFREHNLKLGSKTAFLVNKYIDWRARALDAPAVFRTITDPGRSIAARMMYYWGLSLSEVAHWSAVDPARAVALLIDDLDGRRSAREAEFSLAADIAREQQLVLRDAWQYCREQRRSTLRPAEQEPDTYAEHLRQVIRHAFSKVLKAEKITPMQLRDAFFCQVFLDHCGVSLQAATQDPDLASDENRLAHAWNEAKRQMGVKGSKAAYASSGVSTKKQRSFSLALKLRPSSHEMAMLGAAEVWVGDSDAVLGTCVLVRLQDGAHQDSLPRIQQLLERSVPFKLRVVEQARMGEVPQDFSSVLMRRRIV